MKRFALASALACVLSCTIMAGDIPSGDYAPPAADEPTTNLTALGDIPTSDNAQEGSSRITLTMVQAILGLLFV